MSSNENPSEGFADLRRHLLLDDHDCHDSEISEDYLEQLRPSQ
jgi:hypothetical protein